MSTTTNAQKFTNWRFNPFTNVSNPQSLVEEHLVQSFPESNLYGIQATESIVLDQPSSVTLHYKAANGTETVLSEVPKSQPPSSGEFRVDYDHDTFFGTSLIELNPADDARKVILRYKGLGAIVKSDYTLNQVTSIPTRLRVRGKDVEDSDCPVTSIVAFLGGHYTATNNAGFVLSGPTANTVEAVNAYLPDTWRVCDGTAPNDPDSPVFNSTDRYLPDLTDGRFIRGKKTSGTIGGQSLVVIKGHNHGLGTLDDTFAGDHIHAYDDLSGFNIRVRSGQTNAFNGGNDRFVGRNTHSGGIHHHSFIGRIGNTGSTTNGDGDQTLENRPKFLTCFYIMRIK